MLVIGLTGSIAMGKSEVAKIIAKHGIAIFDSDAEVHKLYDSRAGAELIRPFVAEATFGDKVDRQIITQHVLKDQALLSKLEVAVHREIKRRRQVFIAAAKQRGEKAVIIDTPLLFETGAEKEMDITIVVSANPELQRARALARPKMTEESLNLIMKRQIPDLQKRAKADEIIENNSTFLELNNSVENLLIKLKVI
jgi:dephospho-CoA kinase